MLRQTLVFLAVAASSSFAQMGLDILSPACQSAAISTVGSPFGQCINAAGLLPIATATGSIVQPIDQWLTGLCAQPACSNDTLMTAQSTLEQGCAQDLQSTPIAGFILNATFANFELIKSMACSGYTENRTLCITSLATNLENGLGTPLTINSITTYVQDQIQAGQFSVPPELLCTDCGSALVDKAYPIINNVAPQLTTQNVSQITQQYAQNYCNSTTFASGMVPSTVSDFSAASASASARARKRLF